MYYKEAFKTGVMAGFFGVNAAFQFAGPELEAYNEGLELGKNLALYKA